MLTVPSLDVLAMENWGLVTVQTKMLIYNRGIYPISHKHMINEVLAHEICHQVSCLFPSQSQWFGNLVTMRFWNDLWLNEGFAMMVGRKMADHIDGVSRTVRGQNGEGNTLTGRSQRREYRSYVPHGAGACKLASHFQSR